MPKSRKKPTYTHHKGTNQACVRINGKDHYLGEYGSPESRERYDDLIAEWFSNSGDTARYTLTIDDLDKVVNNRHRPDITVSTVRNM